MKRNVFFLSVAFLAVAGFAAAGTYTIDSAHSDVSFKVRHLISKTSGQFTDFDGTIVADFENLDASSVIFTIKTASIDTKNEDRDNHLRSGDFFDAETYPEITFTSSKITKSGANSYAVTGTLTMHGVSKTVTLPVIFLGEMARPAGRHRGRFRDRDHPRPQGLRHRLEQSAGCGRNDSRRRGRDHHQSRDAEEVGNWSGVRSDRVLPDS